ncbi:hypothetical protein K440DRAFT_128270 [Wilcoxina mikolae CBS 423.85]|nr:hypothetical protein K440DRAFT_128270 [Wilcoxina mikolae CBS 423.85]
MSTNPSSAETTRSLHPETRGNALEWLSAILSLLVAIVLSLRIYSRVLFHRKFGVDDWMIFSAAVFFTGTIVITFLGCLSYGWGYHLRDVPLVNQEHAFLGSWIGEMLTTWCQTLTKLSLCIFYLRLLGCTNNTANKITVYLLMAVVMAWGIGFTGTIIFRCIPVQGSWEFDTPKRRCEYAKPVAIIHVAGDIAIDFAIYILPAKKMWTLRVPRRQKVLIAGLFALGGLVCTASVIRLPAIIKIMTEPDVTWHVYYGYVWANLESSLAIIIACMPSLTPLLIRFIPALTPPKPPYNHTSKFRNTESKSHAFAAQNTYAARSYPLADISTTVTGHHGGGDRGGPEWWEGMTRNDKSEEYILQDGGGTITMTTVIEQTICDEDGKTL